MQILPFVDGDNSSIIDHVLLGQIIHRAISTDELMYDKCKIFHFDVPHISSSCIIEENLINNAVRWSKSTYNPLIIYHYSITANQLLKSLPVRDMTIALDLSSSAIEHLIVFAVKIWMS